ncbi:MAG: hypothetical protein KAG97_12255 [Victivallales bacterium]|nr:hypothetical protein [Victivallales bacterium]
MKEKGKSWIVDVAARTLEGVFFGSLSKVRRKYAAVLDGASGAATKLFYLHAGLVLLAAVTAIGAIVLPVGLIVLLVELLSSSVNREVLAVAILLIALGTTYLVGGAALIYMIGRFIHSQVERAAKGFTHKPE